MKQYIIPIIIGTWLVTISSCGGAPPSDYKTVHLFDWIIEILDNSNQTQSLKLSDRKTLSQKLENIPYVLRIPQGTTLKIKGEKPEEINEQALLYSNDNGDFVTARDFYWTLNKDAGLISFDNANWFTWDPSRIDFYQNLIDSLQFDWIRDDQANSLEINFAWQATPNETLRYWWTNQTLPVVQLKPGDVISAKDGREQTVNLQKTAAFVPKGTIIHTNMVVSGNLLTMETTNSQFIARFLRDIWFFRSSSRILGISFDSLDWVHYFWEFTYTQKYLCKVAEDGSIEFSNDVYIKENNPRK